MSTSLTSILINTNILHFIMLIGPSGCGKTTWINQQNLFNVSICSVDAVIEKHASKQNKTYDEVFSEFVNQAIQITKNQLMFAVQDKKSIVMDQTNLTPESRKSHCYVPETYRKVAVVFPWLEQNEWIKRLQRPGRVTTIETLEKMKASFVFPTLEEGFHQIITL